MNPTVENKLKSIPAGPGVYQHKDADGKVLYVGKAKNLRNRVRQYFQKSRSMDPRIERMLSRATDLEIIVTDSEVEALILEANLIKEYHPKYNIMFKDNKFYPFIRVTVQEEYPRIVFSREQRRDGSRYFGPYVSARAVRQYIDLIERLFLLRTCYEMPKRECLNFHIKRCSGPCVDLVSQEDYARDVQLAAMFLLGKQQEVIQRLSESMDAASA